jgi:hypothetical protein
MRFLLMVIIAVATGALSMTAMQTLMPTNASMRESVQALGGAWAGFQIVDYNPLTAYQRVRAEITKPGNAGIPNFGTAPIPSIKVTGPLFKPYEYKPDPAVQRAISAGIGARIGQDMRRAQDIAAYGRNPMAWCGVPPH